MRTATLHILLSLFACLTLLESRAQDMDLGSLTNSVYRNEYFGLTMTLPNGWYIVDQKGKRDKVKAGLSNVATNAESLKTLVDVADAQLVTLVAALKFPLGTPTNNASILVSAERVRSTKSGREYLLNTKNMLEGGQTPVAFPKEIYSEKLGNVAFDVLDIFRPGDLKLLQRQYSTVMKGYALDIGISFDSSEEEQILATALKSIQFDRSSVP